MATIRQRKGKYHVQVRRRGHPTITKTLTNKQDAQQWARQMEVQIDRLELPANPKELSSVTLGHLVKRYLDEVSVSKRGHEVERWRLNAFLRHPICRKSLLELSPADFARYRDERLKVVHSKTLKTELSPIHNMFEVARDEWGLPIRENPLDRVKLKAVDNRRERRLREGELDRLIEAARSRRNPLMVPIILFAIETAMRRGEILGMHWDHIDWQRRCVTIPEAKNGYSRTIPLTPKALEILSNLEGGTKGMSNGRRVVPRGLESKNLCQSLRIERNNKEFEDGGVFPLSANAVRLSWERIKAKAGILDLHFHDLRHEAISRFFEMGLTVPEVASISGHRDARMLLRYAHAQSKVVQEKINSSIY